jgi:type IV pilus assembly protein PilY1
LRTSASRFIVTSTDTPGATGGIQFQPATAATATKLSVAQQALLNTPTSTDGAAVLAFLRGDRSGESASYRTRAHLLGDTVNAAPVLVREPNASYTDTGYSAFKASQASRTRVLFQGANDGMVHAFVAATGAESWAYVPNLVMANLNNLSLRTNFTHKYYVDGAQTSADVDFNNTDGITTGGDWHTILVGGLGKGGRGYYALDVTTPAASSEVDARNKVLWEFPNSVSNAAARTAATLNMGYSFGKPIIVKTTAKGWVALVTSGYNNGTNAGDSGGDGEGHLYVINPRTGDLIKDIATTGCAATPASSPCGLAQISVSINSSNIVEYVYGGDLMGNVWRFDLTGASAGAWAVSKFASLADAGNAAQPVTTAPVLAVKAGVRTVFVATGLYLGATDIPGSVGANSSSSQTQTMYGLIDSLVALPTPLRAALQQQTVIITGATSATTTNVVNFATQKGWYEDLPRTGERANVQPTGFADKVVVNTNIPSNIPCSPGGSSEKYTLNIQTGIGSGVTFGNVLASSPVLFQLANGQWYSVTHASGDPSLSGSPPINCVYGPNNTIICKEPTDFPASSTIKRTWRQLFLYQ